jgi:uncharacterized protein YgiM (DUF1202 family)
MRPTSVTVSSQTTSAWIPVNYRQDNFNLGIQVTGSGTNTWKVEYTLDNVFDSAVTPTAITADAPLETGAGATPEVGSIKTPCRAVRLNITAYTSGSATMTVLQGV